MLREHPIIIKDFNAAAARHRCRRTVFRLRLSLIGFIETPKPGASDGLPASMALARVGILGFNLGIRGAHDRSSGWEVNQADCLSWDELEAAEPITVAYVVASDWLEGLIDIHVQQQSGLLPRCHSEVAVQRDFPGLLSGDLDDESLVRFSGRRLINRDASPAAGEA